MSMIPFVMWGLSILTGTIIYVCVARKIEQSKLKRLGATGHLFTCDPDRQKGADQNHQASA